MAMPKKGSAMFENKRFKQNRAVEFIALAFILFLYIFLAGSDIRLPGIGFDSANFGLHCKSLTHFGLCSQELHQFQGVNCL